MALDIHANNESEPEAPKEFQWMEVTENWATFTWRKLETTKS